MLPTFRKRVRDFRRDDGGVITIVGLIFLLIMLMVGGLGVDFMHAEMRRTNLQHTLDRAVLAAADLDQLLDPSDVVNDYFLKAGLDGYLTEPVDVDEGVNYRTVSAKARVDTGTLLLPLVGVDSLSNSASGTAQERIANVEVSLVLDISGSMENGSRIEKLQTASVTFIDTLLRSENEDLVSISLVPYSEQVNAGPLLFDEMNTGQFHSYSHCVEFPDSHFDNLTYNSSHTYEQVPFFQWNYSGWNDLTEPVCPRYNYERITPVSQDATALKAQVNSLQPRAGTSIFLGLKWGAMLLDPSMRTIVGKLADSNDVDEEFRGRPADYTDSETLKTIVLMTDGENQSSYRLNASKYNSTTEIERWHNYNMWYYLYRNVSSHYRSGYYYQKYWHSYGNTLMRNICDALRTKGVVVWAVGLEVDSDDLDEMRYCASSDGHFFEATEEDIEDVFSTIARQVNFLRLIQ